MSESEYILNELLDFIVFENSFQYIVGNKLSESVIKVADILEKEKQLRLELSQKKVKDNDN